MEKQITRIVSPKTETCILNYRANRIKPLKISDGNCQILKWQGQSSSFRLFNVRKTKIVLIRPKLPLSASSFIMTDDDDDDDDDVDRKTDLLISCIHAVTFC
jgi:hypothetical protein